MATILKDCDCSPIIIGGVENHVHVLCKLSKTRSMSSVVDDVKKKSSKWIKVKGAEYQNFSEVNFNSTYFKDRAKYELKEISTPILDSIIKDSITSS